MRQYVGITFRDGGPVYTYHNDGTPVAVGDTVRVDGHNGGTDVPVVRISEEPPPFATKPIMERRHD